jgi:BCD family chlorophyll transporter-like MFS transporter
MRAKTFTKFAKQIPTSWLPFADVASPGLPMARLLRLSLFKFTMGITTALMIGTLNRVMIVELFVPAWLVSMMLALPLLVAPFRAVTGYQSDIHVSAFGWRRVPYMWRHLDSIFGTGRHALCLAGLVGWRASPCA